MFSMMTDTLPGWTADLGGEHDGVFAVQPWYAPVAAIDGQGCLGRVQTAR
jgi:hypothetical protein